MSEWVIDIFLQLAHLRVFQIYFFCLCITRLILTTWEGVLVTLSGLLLLVYLVSELFGVGELEMLISIMQPVWPRALPQNTLYLSESDFVFVRMWFCIWQRVFLLGRERLFKYLKKNIFWNGSISIVQPIFPRLLSWNTSIISASKKVISDATPPSLNHPQNP